MPPKVRELIAELERAGFVNRGGKEMKDSTKYVKIVEWSEEDQCYVGSAPGLIFGGYHGRDEKKVFDELCRIVEEAIGLNRKDGNRYPLQLPGATSQRRCRVSPSNLEKDTRKLTPLRKDWPGQL